MITKPLYAFPTDFGRFYAHPASGLNGIGATFLRDLESLGDGPYSPNPSVTNVIGILDEGFLPEYYARLVAEHAVNNLDGIRDTLTKFGPQTAIGVLKAIPKRSNPAALIGDEVHAAIDAHHQGVDVPPLTTITARRMFSRYMEFLNVYKPEVVRSEFTVWSYKHGYAGTGDLLLRFQGRLWVVDTKTGNRVYPKVAMQCSALAHADVLLDGDGNEHPMPQIDRLGVLHLRPMSARLYELEHGEEAFQAFLALKTAFDWVRFYKPTTIPDRPAVQVPQT